MRRQELRVEQGEPVESQSVDQPCQRDLGCIGAARKHALTEIGATQGHAVAATDQGVTFPDLDRMGKASLIERGVERKDGIADPCLITVSAALYDLLERCVKANPEPAPLHPFGKTARDVETVDWDDAAKAWIDPEHLWIIAGL